MSPYGKVVKASFFQRFISYLLLLENAKHIFLVWLGNAKESALTPRLLTVLSLIASTSWSLSICTNTSRMNSAKLKDVCFKFFSLWRIFFPCFTSPKGQRSNLFSCRWGHPCWWTAADHNKNRVSHVTSPPHLGAVMSSLRRHDETCLKHVLKYINFLLISPWPFMHFNTRINLITISNKKR